MPRRNNDYFRNLEKQRQQEYNIQESNAKSKKISNWYSNAELDNRADRKRYNNRMEQIQKEKDFFQEVEKQDLAKKIEKEKKEALGKLESYYAQKKQEEQRNEAINARIIQQSDEIKSLENRLKQKLLSHSQRNQIKELESRRIQERIDNKNDKIDAMRDFERRQAEQNLKRQEADRLMKITLERQLLEKEDRKNKEYETYLKEKKDIEAIVKKIENEERMKQAKIDEKRSQLQSTISEYKIQKENELRIKKQAKLEEEQKILAYQKFQEDRIKAVEAKKAEEDRLRKERTQQVADMSANSAHEAERMRDLIARLQQAQMEKKKQKEAEDMKKKRKDDMEQLLKEREYQLQHKQEVKKKLHEEEKAIEAEMLRRYEKAQEIEKAQKNYYKNQRREYKDYYDGYFQSVPDSKEEKRRQWAEDRAEHEKENQLHKKVVVSTRHKLFQEYSTQLSKRDLLSLAENQDERILIERLYQ